MSFNELFDKISADEISDKFNIFTLVGTDFYAVTAGTIDHYNSMIGSGGGFGLFFRKPSSWCLFRKDRYTLELIEKTQTYTLSFFSNEYKERMLFLGKESGRYSKKMNDVDLKGIQTPSGNIAFQEARLIIECGLTAITTPHPDDFYSQESRDYIDEAYKDANEYRKLVFGEITDVWIKKDNDK
jgi:flavin reductase (DIM6/NTAB) family NADH-FMN oxidoreductase RutF